MKYVIFIKKECPYSKAAIKLIKSIKQKKYKVIDVNEIGGKEKVIKILKKLKYIGKKIKHKTVPIIFENGKFIGGYEELKTKLKKKSIVK